MRRIIWLLVVFLLGVATSQLTSLLLPLRQSAPSEITREATSTAVLGQEVLEETTKVVRVIDGDTVELSDGRKLRYIGLDTPELVHPEKPVECFAQEAKAENERLVGGKTVRLEKDVSETDKYGRLLRYVYVGDIFINEYLIRQGFAQASTYPPDVEYQDRFLVAEKEARDNKRGLWAGCLTSPTIQQFNNVTISPEVVRGASSGCIIKGNISTSGEKIYHLPGCGSYEKTVIDESKGERWFCTEEEAVKAGWRRAKNC